MAGIEGLIIHLCLYLALMLHTEAFARTSAAYPEAPAIAGVAILAMMIMGLYDADQLRSIGGYFKIILRVAFGLLLALAMILLFQQISPFPLLETTALLLGFGLAFIGLIAGRRIYQQLAVMPAFKRRLLVVGAGSRARITETVHPDRALDELPYTVVAFVTPEDGPPVDVAPDRVRYLRRGQKLLDLVRDLKAHEVVVAIRNRRGSLPIKQLLECKLHGITVTDVSSFFERERQQLRLDSLNSSWLVFGDGFRQNASRIVVKRLLDLAASAVLLTVTLPVMLITALAIKLESPGPVFYWQTRVGMGNENFEICKFRSMREDAERDGVAQWAVNSDDRVTRVGQWIRKLRIDELPQIFNVLKGEMSFVGPRPERPFFVEQLSDQIPYFLVRHSIRPGITGWAQVRYPYGASVQDAREKLQYDLYYVKNHTLFLDVLIILETIGVVLFGRGAR